MLGSENMIKPKHLKVEVNDDYRLIAVSDIHGHLDRFKALLKKVNYQPDDYLVIIGDFVEKGDQVIETIHFVQELDKYSRVFVLAGNCEWALDALLTIPDIAGEIPKYLKRVTANGSIRQIYNKYNFSDGHESDLGVQKTIASEMKKELKYISHLPITLKFNNFLFVHAGLEPRRDYKHCGLSSMLEMQRFLELGHMLDEIVIVGHLPTSNYKSNRIDNSVIIDYDKKIICIDGGTGVKPISQLNALIIESKEQSVSITYDYIQEFPEYEVIKEYRSFQKDIHKISFPYFEVEIIKQGKDFSFCRQVKTGIELLIKNEFLYKKNDIIYCLDDYTDCILNIDKGDIVKVIDIYGDYVYGIKDDRVGWMKKDCIDI